MPTKTIIRTYLLLTGLYTLSASLIWAVNTLFLLHRGRLDIFEVFVVNAIFAAATAVFELPTGLVADTRGRRLSFLLSVVLLLAGTLGYAAAAALGGGIVLFAAMSMVLGLGFSFYSGAMEAWLVDALTAAGFTGTLDGVFARAAFTSGAAMLIGSVGGGLLGTIDLSIPYLVRALLLAGLLAIGLVSLRDLGFSPPAPDSRTPWTGMASLAYASLRYGWRSPSVRLLVAASSTLALFTSWGFYSWQPYFLALAGRDAAWVTGILAAAISTAAMAGNAVVEWLGRYCARRTTLLAWAVLIHAAAALGVGLATSFWTAVLFYLLVNAAVGVFQPVRQAYLHQMTPGPQRATVASFDSLVSNGASTAGQMALGYLARAESIAAGYAVGGALTFAAFPVVALLRSRRDAADLIVGRAAKRSPCAAPGLPSVAAVDTGPPDGDTA
jgi:MFS family permease